MNFSRKNYNKGFTLIEILLVIGIILLIVVGLYSYYNKKRTDENVNLQIVYLNKLQKSLDTAYFTSSSFATLNTTNAITWGLIPTELVISPTTAKNIFGGALNVNASPLPVLGFNGYSITLNNLTSENCNKLSLSKYGLIIPQMLINGVDAKIPGTQFTNTDIANISTACSIGNNNTIDFRAYPLIPPPLVSANPSIPKINEYYIPTVGNNVISSPGVCSGGSSWNGSFCGCPISKTWDGTSCVTTDINSNSCQYGKGWGVTSCVALPGTLPTFLRYSSPPISALPTVAGSVSSPPAVYSGQRWVPSAYVPPVQELNPQASCTSAGGNWDGKVCNYCPDASTTVIKDSSGAIVVPSSPAHAAKSTWDGFRCVTPAVAW